MNTPTFSSDPEEVNIQGASLLVDETIPDAELMNSGLAVVMDSDECRIREYDDEGWGNAVAKQQTRTASSMALTGPFSGIDLNRLNSLPQAVDMLSKNIPTNQYGLPAYIYRADMLDHVRLYQALSAASGTTTTTTLPSAQMRGTFVSMPECFDMLDAATVMLSYDEGYPVLPNGIPLWQQMDFEPRDAHAAFIDYLELGGVRKLVDMIAYPLDQLQAFSKLYYWNVRVKAYDLFRTAHHQKVKLQRMMDTENKHYQMAERMLRKVGDYLEAAIFDNDTLTPEKAINMMEKLVKIQRISAGMPANGESKENTDLRPSQPVQVIMQQLNQSNASGQESKVVDSMDLLRSNPDAIDKAQELIIQVQQSAKEAM